MGKTFGESLFWIAFADEWPLWSSAKERAHYWTHNADTVPEIKRAYELGNSYRNGEWSPELELEFNALVGLDDSFTRFMLKQSVKEQGEIWMG